MTNPNLTVLRGVSREPVDVPASGWAGAIVTAITVVDGDVRAVRDGGAVEEATCE